MTPLSTSSGLELHLEKLRSFRAVARAGSFHGAAAALRVSQPSLSRSVMALERALGARLFERSRNGSRLTREGRLVLEFCDRLFGDISSLEAKVRNPGEALAGVLRIGTVETLAWYFWPGFLGRFARRHPALQLRIVSGDESSHRSRLLAGGIQMVVEAEPAPDERVRSVALYRDVFRFYARAPRPGKAADAPLIHVPAARDRLGIPLREQLLAGGVEAGRLAYELDSFSSALAFARAGLGVAVLPGRLARADVKERKLEAVRLRGFPSAGFGEHRICASFLEENRTDPGIRALLGSLRKPEQAALDPRPRLR